FESDSKDDDFESDSKDDDFESDSKDDDFESDSKDDDFESESESSKTFESFDSSDSDSKNSKSDEENIGGLQLAFRSGEQYENTDLEKDDSKQELTEKSKDSKDNEKLDESSFEEPKKESKLGSVFDKIFSLGAKDSEESDIDFVSKDESDLKSDEDKEKSFDHAFKAISSSSTEEGDVDQDSEQDSDQESKVKEGESFQDSSQESLQQGSSEEGDVDQDSEQDLDQNSDVENGDSTQQSSQESSQVAESGENIDQETSQETSQNSDVENGDSTQQSSQESSQVAESGENIDQETSQETIQEVKIDEGRVEQVAEQISEQIALEGGKTGDLKNLVDKELKNNPTGAVSQSLEALTGMIATGDLDEDEIKQIAKILNIQIAQGEDITQIFAPTIIQVAGEKFGDVIIKDLNKYDDDGDRHNNDNDRKHHYHTKKIIKYKNDKCLTQSSSIPLTGKIGPKTPVLLGDFFPCELKDGRATLNLPSNPNLQFIVMHIDKKGENHDGVSVEMEKIQSLSKNNGLFIVNFDDKMEGENPITGEERKIKDINAIALFNKSKQTIDFKSGNSLAISAVLKS
ncbi:MAG: hypothetical protein ACE5SW_08015, partial [Nitrososphaeraceae archaeon]